ncbi:MAG: cupin domain-containing protein [Proteobacteria bacterium]|nr:cupin domain-containing protein [Pseudomonadota bacterium]
MRRTCSPPWAPDLIEPIDLLSLPAGPPQVVGREAGFALKVLRPTADAESIPPGQGQVLIVLEGTARIEEAADDDAKVVHTARHDRAADLPAGSLWLVANDARWTLTGDAVVLAISTSVPRQLRRLDDLPAIARGRPHMAPRQLFTNEMVRVELVAARGRLPFRGWVPYDHTTPKVEFALILRGSFRARVGGESQMLSAGSLLRVPPDTPHNFRARGRGTSIGIVISALMERREADVPVERDHVRGFTPFGRG